VALWIEKPIDFCENWLNFGKIGETGPVLQVFGKPIR
jgi:hypothetical protein